MPELADIFSDQRERLPQQLSSVQRHAVRDICVCRTPAMERGTLYLCQNCGIKHFIWKSCGNRNCPKCGNDKITKWLAKRQAEILPLDYYMITFPLPAKPLMKLFKGKFKAKIAELEHIKDIPPGVWSKDWVVDCKNVGNCMSSFKYLGTYMQRIFISNDRIEKYDGENVTFRYTESINGQAVHRIMSALAFIKMFLRHVLPSGFQKTRYYGLLGSARKKTLKDIRIMILTSRGQVPSEPEEFLAHKVKCSKCGATMILSSVGARGPPQEAVII
ncbi:MAG: transposase [Victivallaceae bacterium]|nr:transposase [Victivallaceae bacterium]